MIKGLGDFVALAWVVLALIAFGLSLVAFIRLFAQAHKRADRREAIRRVLNIKPRADQEWPNNSREADVIAGGAAIGVVLFSVALVWLFVTLRR